VGASKLILLIDFGQDDFSSKIIELLNSRGAGYWHWYKDSWIIKDSHGMDETWWRDSIKEKCPSLRFTVVSLGTNASWSGFDVPSKFEWFHSNWE
jgi:hypothetical protein